MTVSQAVGGGVGPSAGPATAPPRRPGPRNGLLAAAGLVTFFGMLELLPRAGVVSADYLPPTSRVAQALAAEATDAEFWTAVADTLTGWIIGLAIATVAGIVVGVVISIVPHLRAATASCIEFLRPIPSVALIPLAVLLYGTDLRSTLLLVVYASFWQVLIQVLYGVQDVDPIADDTARSYGLGRLARVRYLLWPTALPYVMTGVRLAAAVALVLAITAELIIGSPGLGSRIAVAQTSNAVPAMYALVVVTGLLGVLINLGARAVERRVLSWHQSVRGEAGAVIRILRQAGLVLGLPALLFAAWWLASDGSESFYFPPLRTILSTFADVWTWQRLGDDVLPSVARLAAGYLTAVLLGVSAGVVIGSYRRVRAATEPVLEFLRAIPPPVLVPVIMLFAGIGDGMKILVIVSGCVWPVLLNTVEGVRAVDGVLAEATRSYGIRGAARLRHLVLRSASPQIFAGARQALSIAIILMVISEMFAASNGLGFTIVQFQRGFAIPEMWSGILLLGLLGVTLSVIFRVVEARTLAWYHGLRRTQRSS